MSAPFWGETPPATPVSPAEAVDLVRDWFGLDGVARPLGSNQETNLRIDADAAKLPPWPSDRWPPQTLLQFNLHLLDGRDPIRSTKCRD